MKETKLLWNLIVFIVLLPWNLLMILFGKKKFDVLYKPLRQIYIFISEYKVTYWLIVINIIAFIIEIILLSIKPEIIQDLIFNPATWTIKSMVTSWFLHANIAHLFGNMLFLLIFGRVVEEKYGFKMLYLYVFSGIIADVFSAFFGFGGIGASGAIAGLIGVGILIKPFGLTYVLGFPLPLTIVGVFALVSDIRGLLVPSNINHFAHLGGYASSLVLFVVSKNKKELINGLIIAIIIGILVVMFGIL